MKDFLPGGHARATRGRFEHIAIHYDEQLGALVVSINVTLPIRFETADELSGDEKKHASTTRY